jgi:ABC-type lipoprotein export system ATPase subunit
VRLDGVDPYALDSGARARWRARRVGFVFQQFHLIPYLSVLDNVLAAALAVPSSNSRERAMDLIERFGLGPRAEHAPAELSTGEKQRTALARALFHRPPLILADEPTGNLDAENAARVLEYLRGYAREGGGVMLVTHDAAAGEPSGRRVRMREGRVEAEPS